MTYLYLVVCTSNIPDPEPSCQIGALGEEEARGPSSPSPRKRRQRTACCSSPLCRPCRRSPHSLLLPIPPPALPRDPDLSLTLLGVRRGRVQGYSASFSDEKETEERGAPLSLAPLCSSSPSFPSFPSFSSYSPCSPLCPDACMFACVPSRVDCCICPFRLIPRAPSALRPQFRCAVHVSTADGSRPPRPRG